MPRALLALGSNLGDREAILESVAGAIDELSAVRSIRRSSWHATQPIGGPAGQGEFLNGALLIETELSPGDLLRETQRAEQRLGRERTQRWAARTLDIDILLYGDRVIDEPDLQVPHPRMSFRPFVLAPAAEIAAEMVHPVLGATVGDLWHQLQHGEDVVAICGGLVEDRRRLMEALVSLFPPDSFEALSKTHPLELGLFPTMRVRATRTTPDANPSDQNRMAAKMDLPVAVMPKLQVFFYFSKEGLSQRVLEEGSMLDEELWQRFQKLPWREVPPSIPYPNVMARLIEGIPTLTLDPQDDSAHQLIEAAAALEAVWPDLCRTGS